MKEEITNKVQISFELRDIINRIWLEKIFISKITSIAAVISVFVALALPNFYSASALLAPADQSTGSLSGMMQRVGGIASLAGISLPSGDEGNKVQLGIELMTSRSFIGNFVERRNLLPDLMAFESWDMSTGEIEYWNFFVDELNKQYSHRHYVLRYGNTPRSKRRNYPHRYT